MLESCKGRAKNQVIDLFNVHSHGILSDGEKFLHLINHLIFSDPDDEYDFFEPQRICLTLYPGTLESMGW